MVYHCKCSAGPRFGLSACAEHELRLSSLLGLTRPDVVGDCCSQREYLLLNRDIKDITTIEVTSQRLLAGEECYNNIFGLLKLCCC